MTLDNINVDNAVHEVKTLLQNEQGLSPALRSAIEIILMLITLMLNCLTLNIQNSSKPPSSDPHREKKKRSNGRQPGGQKGHAGNTLEIVDDPDDIQVLPVDRDSLPEGDYQDAGFEIRQVIDVDISRFVTEYRAQILVDKAGKRFVAPFPEGVSATI